MGTPPQMTRATRESSGSGEIQARESSGSGEIQPALRVLAMVVEAAAWRRIQGWSKGSRRCLRPQGAPPWTDRDRQLFLKSPLHIDLLTYLGNILG